MYAKPLLQLVGRAAVVVLGALGGGTDDAARFNSTCRLAVGLDD